MGWSFKASGLLSLFIALVNLGLVLWLWKSRKDYKFLVYTTLGLVLTFVSITVPIQLDGLSSTLFAKALLENEIQRKFPTYAPV